MMIYHLDVCLGERVLSDYLVYLLFVKLLNIFFPAGSGVPRHLDTQRIREDLLKMEDVQSVDELNVWALTADKTAALVHLQLSE